MAGEKKVYENAVTASGTPAAGCGPALCLARRARDDAAGSVEKVLRASP